LNPNSEVDRGDLTQSAGRECHSSGFIVFSDTVKPSSSHPGSASRAISSPPTSELKGGKVNSVLQGRLVGGIDDWGSAPNRAGGKFSPSESRLLLKKDEALFGVEWFTEP